MKLEAEGKAGGARLRSADGRSGDGCQIVEPVAPLGGETAVIKELQQTIVADRTFALQRWNPKTKRRNVVRSLEA